MHLLPLERRSDPDAPEQEHQDSLHLETAF
jgi:hypothetical protein